jgi:predicted DNA-binding transcriptional regulator AlpA
MPTFSTRQAAQKLGIGHSTLAHYVSAGKVPAPSHLATGKRIVHVWSEEDIERVRKALPKIANGRKTRYTKQKRKAKTKK